MFQFFGPSGLSLSASSPTVPVLPRYSPFGVFYALHVSLPPSWLGVLALAGCSFWMSRCCRLLLMLLSVSYGWFVDVATRIHLSSEGVILTAIPFLLGERRFPRCFRLAPHWHFLVLTVLYTPFQPCFTVPRLWFVLIGDSTYSFASCFKYKTLCDRCLFPF